MQEHYLVIVMKREESKVFSGVQMCLREKLDRGERESALETTQNLLFFAK